jgi:hypothetical protein
MMTQRRFDKSDKPSDEASKDILDPKDHVDASAELRRTLIKRLALSGFIAPAVLVTLLKKPAAASP